MLNFVAKVKIEAVTKTDRLLNVLKVLPWLDGF